MINKSDVSRIREISEEMQRIITDNRDNALIQRMFALNEEFAIISATNTQAFRVMQQQIESLLDLVYLYLEAKDELEDFDAFVNEIRKSPGVIQ